MHIKYVYLSARKVDAISLECNQRNQSLLYSVSVHISLVALTLNDFFLRCCEPGHHNSVRFA